MKKIENASVKLNENGLLVDVAISMKPNDGDGLYIVHFAIVQEEDDTFKFSVLATTNLSDAQTEEDLLENTSEIWSLPLNSQKNFEKARLILATMVKDGFYYQRTIYSWPDREDVEKADKQDVHQLKGEFNKLLGILREKQKQL
tara:strand:+ start:1811 stop:2242 length:432 start_codon:yes stop_codon:yes gene_type:complete